MALSPSGSRGWGPSGLGFPAFVHFHVFQHRDQIFPMRQTALDFESLQHGRGFVAPAEFFHERVPDHQIVGVHSPTVFVAPRENFLVRAAGQHAGPEFGVFDPQKAATKAIGAHGEAEVGVEIGMEFALLVQANLVEHPGEPAYAGGGFVAAFGFCVHGCVMSVGLSEAASGPTANGYNGMGHSAMRLRGGGEGGHAESRSRGDGTGCGVNEQSRKEESVVCSPSLRPSPLPTP